MTDMDLLSLPLTYLKIEVFNTDTRAHNISLYYDNSAEVAID